jgi:hypothetical protein
MIAAISANDCGDLNIVLSLASLLKIVAIVYKYESNLVSLTGYRDSICNYQR